MSLNLPKLLYGVTVGYGRCGTARTRGNDIQAWGVTREVHGKDVIWMVR